MGTRSLLKSVMINTRSVLKIVAPETGQDFGKQARANLAGQVEGKAVVFVWSKKDGYGRLLGTVLHGVARLCEREP